MGRLISTSAMTLATMAIVLAGAGCGSGSIRYDPEPYREQIENLETFIHKSESKLGDGGELARLSAELSGAMGQTIENHRVKQTISNRLISYGQHFSDVEVGGGQVDLELARQMWTEIRGDLFEPADWFQ